VSYRCVSAFEFDNRMYPYGARVDDGDPILATHLDYFAQVGQSVGAVDVVETATAGPGEMRAAVPARARRRKSSVHQQKSSDPVSEEN